MSNLETSFAKEKTITPQGNQLISDFVSEEMFLGLVLYTKKKKK